MKKQPKNSLVIAALLVISIITIIAYYPGMSAGFYFDDKSNFSQHPALQWTEVSKNALHETLTEAWAKSRPVANISLAITHVYTGLNPAPYHWTNLLIHLAVGFALFWVIRLMQIHHTDNKGNAWLAALAVFIFLVHPLNIQAVTYVIQRMTSMATLFLLLAFGSYLTARIQASPARRNAYFAAATVFFLLSIGSKEIGVLLLPLLVLYEYSFHGTTWRKKYFVDSLSMRKVVSLTGAALLIIAIVLGFWHLTGGSLYWHETMPNRDFSGLERVLTQGRVHFFYLSLLFWPAPSRLNLDHDFLISRGLFEPFSTSLALLALLFVLLSAIRFLPTRPRLAFPVLAYLLFHSMESAPLNLELVFEHRMYLPMTMLAILIGLNSGPFMKNNRNIIYVAVIGVGLLLSYATYQRNTVWADPIVFLQDAARKSPDKFRPHYNLGTVLGKRGMIQESRVALERAVVLQPADAKAHNQLGNVYMYIKQLDLAEKQYRLAIQYDPEYGLALYNLSLILGSQQRYAEQKEVLQQFIEHAEPGLEKQKQWAIGYIGQLNEK